VATLVMLKFDTPDGAEKSLDLAERLQKEQLLQIIDGATVIWPKGKKKRRRASSRTSGRSAERSMAPSSSRAGSLSSRD
jgi:uncharacterized membrane protein